MTILLVGSGAREHAIARALDLSPQKKEIHCLASNMNPGIAGLCNELIVNDINNPDIVSNYAKEAGVSLAIIGPENPLACGVADSLLDVGVSVVGPKKVLAKIETSKAFARKLLTEYAIPGCPKYRTYSSTNGVLNFLTELGEHFVVKYDGLAGGKGVKVSGDHLHSHDDALAYCQKLVDEGGEFIIEEKLIGQEFSLMSFCDGEHLKHMPAVQDHKRAYEGDKGPNTGGMGTYSDANHGLPFLTDDDIAQAHAINISTAKALKDKFGEGYKGILYGGFMATANGVKLIEYNARFGDPEAMNVLSLLESDFIDICVGIADGTLGQVDVRFANKATVCKYAVPEGYPDSPIKDEPIDVSGISNPDGLFYASVNIQNGQLVEAGSRTIAVVGVADSVSEAETIAEKEVSSVRGPLFHRTDIGTDEVIQKRIDHMNSLR
ncbi:MAG TPA: phosphoribosylamine--glycine ligase [Candidatus Marinimicrobia bacterium]|jgi:phosphoribosylamine--glycine ligase|nr:phosphoribosylamine--glycine ligase [Rhodobiaceae bacterium]MDP6260574.1 phosphoribosylamine--glycine ligase [Candidatus Neomarinimicrobiota bacterium]MDP7565912.1 phosphoribosylamine--glycine ligase [Candidatus Neomarinimicrobiota bacterium]MEE1505873.1 phosphoribosylamine--glycine ligase [Candidatus Neomarinimicrobiota bacterium]MEE1572532.1 phosphoribosylamine--glycine ligase [Candidatus Neomarinimicrobiota bacterium]|tara:strand:- start:1884 stop:3191 length:1308 start_codon:yes stop_codon:yes gene_type:complete